MAQYTMLWCRCHDCGRQQAVRPQLDPRCGACGGDLAVDAQYHPEHAMAVDFGGPPVYATPSGALASEAPAPYVTLVHVLKPKNGVG